MATLDVFQSMWAMEFRRPDGFEWSLQQKLEKIHAAGFKGVSFDFPHCDRSVIKLAIPLLKKYKLDLLINAFVKNVDDYQQVVDFCIELNYPTRFIGIIGVIEPWNVTDIADMTKLWLKVGKAANIPTYVETHRNCMTNDLLFTLQLMDEVPDLLMVADLSHVLVNQEWYLPMQAQAQSRMSQLLSRAEAFHGRIATREQIQIAPDFAQHKTWVELFESWWREGFSHWIDRHGKASQDACVFLCELGPPPYAITDSTGYELSDRWEEALIMKASVENIWKDINQ
ncbi:MAG: hypothetical protein ACI9YO_001220 [Gammaproteobacteria bacterium]|jgi:hypothetical protein